MDRGDSLGASTGTMWQLCLRCIIEQTGSNEWKYKGCADIEESWPFQLKRIKDQT